MTSLLDQFAFVLSDAGLIIIRWPTKGRPGKRRNAIPARQWRPALTALMARYGLRQKDLYGFEPILHPDDWDPNVRDPWRREERRSEAEALLQKLLTAYEDGRGFEDASLYQWDGVQFQLVREARRS